MRRLHQVMNRAALSLMLWLGALLYFSVAESDKVSHDFYNSHFFVVLQMPLYALVMFGAYAMCSIGYHLLVLEDCNAASEELQKEIVEARTFLKKKGMKFD